MKYFYPAICSYDQKKGMFFVVFPDLIGCEAKAGTMNEAAKKARESLAASLLEMEEKALPIPSATSERQLRLRESGKRICTFLVDMDEYRAYKTYKVRHADAKSAEWAGEARKGRRQGFLAKVFGFR